LIQQTYDRLQGVADERVYVVTSAALADGVRAQLPELPFGNVIEEPQPKDTAIAIGLAAGLIGAKDPEAILAVLPADHVIRPAAKFREAVLEAAAVAGLGEIVTFGIPAREPRTGYGYIQRGQALDHPGSLAGYRVEAFKEKPDRKTAEGYVAAGGYYWNSGMFVWSAETVLSGLRAHQPAVAEAVAKIVDAWETPKQEAVLAEAYGAAEKISIDYALLEHADSVAVLEAEFDWSDVGAWSAIPELFDQDEAGNTVRDAPFIGLDSNRCMVQGDGRLIALLGVEDLVVVQTGDATLVCRRERAEEVKQLIQQLEGDLSSLL
jgi:mannose-1-phosphate guanylyltransferase